MRFLADENFDGRILRGLRRQNTHIDIIRTQDTPLYQADDPTLLAWAAQEERILLTHDARTIPRFASERIAQNLPMPGVIIVPHEMAIGQAIEDLHLIMAASSSSEYVH